MYQRTAEARRGLTVFRFVQRHSDPIQLEKSAPPGHPVSRVQGCSLRLHCTGQQLASTMRTSSSQGGYDGNGGLGGVRPYRGDAMKRSVSAVVGASVLGVGNGAFGVGSCRARVCENSRDSPASLAVPQGSKVTWSIRQGTHTVTDSASGCSARRHEAPGSTYSFTFINAGTFAYRSTVGPAIKGSVVRRP